MAKVKEEKKTAGCAALAELRSEYTVTASTVSNQQSILDQNVADIQALQNDLSQEVELRTELQTQVSDRKRVKHSYKSDTPGYFSFELNSVHKGEIITITDQYGGCIELLGTGFASTENPDYQKVRCIRKSFGIWKKGSTIADVDDTNAAHKLRAIYFDQETNHIFISVGNYTAVSVEGIYSDLQFVETLPDTAKLVPQEFAIAQYDKNGKDIADTYATKAELEATGTQVPNNSTVTTTTGAKVESMTQAEYNALEIKDPKTLYNIIDKSSIVSDFNEASADNTFSANFIKNNFLNSQATFTVSSNEDLAKWATNASGNNYTSVYIAPGTYTLETGSINLTATGTKIVEGHPNAKLVFKSTNVAINTNYYPALYYTTKPSSQEYKMTNVIIDVTSMNATSSNVYATGFYNCINMLNCYAASKSAGTKDWQAAYGYYSCSFLINCQGAASGANNGNAYTFAACSCLTNCIADETVYPATYDSKADIIPYASCSYLINCQAKATNGYELTRGYFGCNYLTGCSATVSSSTSTSTEISGFSRCSRMINCYASITNTTGKTLTNVGGFINSSMIDNCTSSDQIYNSSYVFKCNASAYTSSYADNYLTACGDTPTGGYNHTGTLSWSNNKWQ